MRTLLLVLLGASAPALASTGMLIHSEPMARGGYVCVYNVAGTHITVYSPTICELSITVRDPFDTRPSGDPTGICCDGYDGFKNGIGWPK